MTFASSIHVGRFGGVVVLAVSTAPVLDALFLDVFVTLL